MRIHIITEVYFIVAAISNKANQCYNEKKMKTKELQICVYICVLIVIF